MFSRPINRRNFCRQLSLFTAGASSVSQVFAQTPTASQTANQADQAKVLELIEAHRPTRLKRLPADFNARVGATHVAGKYHLTDQPFLLEGAEKLLALGTRLGKFWLEPKGVARSYPFNSQWGEYQTFVDLVKSEYFQWLFALPFKTLIFEAHTPVESGWKRAGLSDEFYAGVTREFYELTTHLYRTYRERDFTIVLQHWEGDWLLRGRGGELWNPPPKDWKARCEWMQRWLAARQSGVTKARAEFGTGARCRVAHAAEVNRVTDLWKGIPTMTEHVLPQVELDLVSYSSYDGMKDSLTLWRCLQEIRQHARTGSLFGPRAVYVGEIGVPENEQPQRLAERWDEWMGVMLAAEANYIVHWELYCNEISRRAPQDVKTPITNPDYLRGFWLVKPDGSLSVSGKYFQSLWQRA